MSALVTLPTAALAQKVVVVPPDTSAISLGDAFNRLKAELTLHHFDVLVAPAQLTDNPTVVLTRLARDSAALAAIAIVYGPEGTSIQIWLVDRVSGKTSMRALQVEPTEDSPSLLAIRAVDLLRTSLREFEPGDRPPSDVVGVQQGPVPRVVQALAHATAPSYTLLIEAMALHQRPRIGTGYGPLLGASYRAHDFVSVGIAFAGPILGARFSSPLGISELRQELAWGELLLGTQCAPRLRAEVGVLIGALFLQAQGQPHSPWVGRADHTWATLQGVQGNVQWQFLQRLALQVSVRAMGTLPKLGIALGDDQTMIQIPLLAGSLGVRVSL